MFVTNGGVWKTIGCSLTIWCRGGVCEITKMLVTLSTFSGVVLLETTVSCGVCVEALYAIRAAEDISPSAVGLHNSIVGEMVIIEPPCCDASLGGDSGRIGNRQILQLIDGGFGGGGVAAEGYGRKGRRRFIIS
ncbi:unnamed protein product [Lactuca saligna]|uniref:Uncharacterized protein n=1 Tax=Lactuca saligna TaxID=75948 RepID=A0AA35Z5T3_LACSI|nr:unnamed protein product [Lactuca saligna]